MKNLIHITEDISRASGGVRTVVKDIHSKFPEALILATEADVDDSEVKVFDKKGPWLHASSLTKFLAEVPENSIFHLHGVWMHAQYTAAKVAAKRNIPFIISPHGMYEPWLWKEGALKKKLYFKILASSAFAKARYIHAITRDEQKNLQQLFPKTEVVCIPNAISIEKPVTRSKTAKAYFLFIGRIHPKKGVELLINVFQSLLDLDFELKIAGPENDHSLQLQELAKTDARISFLGAVRGAEKQQLYRNAHAFIAPSYSEVVGMVNLEAAMMATPVITTYQTGLLKEWNDRGGSLINPNFEELKNVLIESSNWSEAQRDDRGNNLRNFVIEQYSWKVNLPKWEALYNSML
ncbi:glycosyltransferase [Nonlabens sp. Asnod3-A02]|uniref:glycosyltransferase n=1 Tax=Nonlabens sp. Asnod3-A02 TaxID=3160579 RepID=UPI00386B1E7B